MDIEIEYAQLISEAALLEKTISNLKHLKENSTYKYVWEIIDKLITDLRKKQLEYKAAANELIEEVIAIANSSKDVDSYAYDY